MTEERSVVEYEYVARDGQKIKLTPDIIKRFLVSGKPEFVTMQELFYFMGVCKSRGLNPFIRDCYLIKYTPNDAAAIITSIDFYRKRARAREDCQGWKTGVIVQTKDGRIKHSSGLVLEGEKILGGWFEATPKGWAEPYRKEVNLSGYIKRTKEGNVTRFWSEDNQPSQIAKVAEAQGLRAIWGDEFQGLYVDAEMQSQDAQSEFDKLLSEQGMEEGKTEEKMMMDIDSLEKAVQTMTAKYPWPKVKEFLGKIAESNKVGYEVALSEAIANGKKFVSLFTAWLKKNQPVPPPPSPPTQTKPVTPPPPPVVEKKDEKDIWGDMAPDKGGEGKTPFIYNITNYKEVLTEKNWALVTRLLDCTGMDPDAIDEKLTESGKERFIDQCKKALAKQEQQQENGG
jgi:phage recombination protein Bet